MQLFSRRVYNEPSSENFFQKIAYFCDYQFFEDTHTYTYNNRNVEKSVTQFIERFVEPFDEAKWLPKKAKERGITPEELKLEWTRKSLISTTTGTLFHKFMEESLSGKTFQPDYSKMSNDITCEVQNRYSKLIELATNFLLDTKHKLTPVKSEFIVGYEDKIAGQIDELFYNNTTGNFDIYDWKTNKAINCWNTWHKCLLKPFGNLDDCELNIYSLQLSTYKALLKKQNIHVDKLNIVWFNENNKSYQVMPCKDVSDNIANILFN